MKNLPPQIVLNPRLETCGAKTRWDRESAVLQSIFVYPERFPRDPQTLQERIEQEVGIYCRPYRVILGDIDIVLEEINRISSIEVRTNPARWKKTSLPDLPAELDNVWVAFQVEYDSNQIASLDFPVQILWDEYRGQLAFSFDVGRPVFQWYAIADTVAIALDAHGVLCEFRFAEVEGIEREGKRGSIIEKEENRE